MPLIFTGIRVAAVTVVATAPIAAIAGGGGLGDVIVNQASYRLEGVLGASFCVMALSAGVWVALAGVTESDRRREACARLGSRRRPVTERRSSDPEAHPPSRQGGVRDLARGRDRPRPIRRHGPPGTPTPAPTIVIGTKNFPEEYILGELYKQALAGEGLHRLVQGSLGSTEMIQTALTSGKINFYPEYTGVIVQDVFHHRLLGQDRRRDVRARQAARGGEGLHASSTRRRSTTPTSSR